MSKILLGILIFTLVFSFSHVNAQHTNILVSSQIINTWDPNEPSIVINPVNTDQILIGTNMNHYFYSSDGGYSWTNGGVMTSSHGVHGDPCVIADKYGSFYFFHLSNPPGPAFADRIVCQKLTDLDSLWSDGSYTGLNGKMQDKEWAVADFRFNNIYVTWTQFDVYGSTDPEHRSNIMFSRSVDNGETWSDAVNINKISGDCLDDDNTVEGAVPAVGHDGEVYVSWSGPAGLVFDRSFDEGETWLDNDVFVSHIPGGWVINIPGIYRCNGMPVTACDLSDGPYKGTIYINWADQKKGVNDTDIWISKSTDNGATWSVRKRVNDDPPGKHQFFTWMTVDKVTGYIYIVFYDRRNYDDLRTDVYLAVSRDGGETFSNHRISETPFIPNKKVFLGDYNNISAHNNVIRPVWIRLDDMELSLWTAIIDPDFLPDKPAGGIPDNFEIIAVYPNPFNSSTIIKYYLPGSGYVDLKAYNILGKEVDYILTGNQTEGINHIEWQPRNISSGIYFIRMKFKNNVKIKKTIYLK
ncbi:T9SS type A sorting domain-containing protein [candidate division KSB1 bacterium]